METIFDFHSGLQGEVFDAHGDTCILFLAGGNTDIGKDRFTQWQKDLLLNGISSVSFDHSGVAGSGTALSETSLASRIEEAVHVSAWMKEHLQAQTYILYGVSMGGYTALGLTEKLPSFFSKLILHAPAAYAEEAHGLHFGPLFSDILRRDGSWQDSMSFNWFSAFDKPILLITADKDEVIPEPITDRYRRLGSQKAAFLELHLPHAPHNVWHDTEADKKTRALIFESLVNFVRDTGERPDVTDTPQ